MNRIKNSVIAFGGLLLVIALIALATPRPTQGQGGDPVGPTKPVLVDNTSAESLPVTGKVNVSNLRGSPLPVSDVDNPARQPFQRLLNSINGSFTVPDGKRLVIEYVSGTLDGGASCTANYVFITTTITVAEEAQILSHIFPPTPISSLRAVFGQQTRIYSDPNTVVSARLNTNPNNCDSSFVAYISGYLVDVP